MTIQQITFSPTGGTRRVCDLLSKGFGSNIVSTELCAKESQIEKPTISENDIVVIGMPVFAGRVPGLAINRLRNIDGKGARCVIVAVYGNREFEDALVEMQDAATACGFIVIAAVSAIAEHNVVREFAAGRPNADDGEELSQFAVQILQRVINDAGHAELALPGNRPYKEINLGPFPEADATCMGCGLCVEACPTDAISVENPQITNKELCITCMRCVAVCPTQSRSLGSIVGALAERLRPLCSKPKHNELFI